MITFKPGDIFLTRWFDEDKNSSPGYWNHAAILDEHGNIVESLMDKGVVKQDFDEWFNSLESYCVVRYFDSQVALQAAREAAKYIGKPYRLITSTFTIIGPLRTQLGLNCVALVRLCYRDAAGYDTRVSFPDNFLEREGFRKIYGN